MIRKIRKTHKIIWLILAVLLPLIFIASIAIRHSEPVNEKIPNKSTAETLRR
jgi:glucan phosphoethanolaminetransferase (alkaline phosphatase superfamily)